VKKKSARKAPPKSQSEKVAEKKAKALERAGTSIIDGKPKKAEKILAAQKKRESKKPTAKQAVEVLSEAHALETQITSLDHKIDGIKEEYKELKALREKLLGRLRSEVREMGQGRLPFHDAPKEKKADAKPAAGEKKSATTTPVASGTEPKADAIDDELAGKSTLDEMEGAGGAPKSETSAA
jgi:hypothetical protein